MSHQIPQTLLYSPLEEDGWSDQARHLPHVHPEIRKRIEEMDDYMDPKELLRFAAWCYALGRDIEGRLR